MILKGTVDRSLSGTRLDDGAHRLFPQLSKSRIRRIIDWGGCTISNVLVRVASRPLREGDEIVLGVMEPERCVELSYGTADLLMEDGEYLAIAKAAGINCQRTPYQLKGTVEYAVSVYMKSIGSSEPARVIHRLDRGTSGVMFFPKTRRAAAHISALLKEGDVEKIYWALITGTPASTSWTVDLPIAKVDRSRYGVATPGKEAQTEFRVIATGNGASLVEARPLTGRTHQIRVHLAHAGLPIVGDATYGGQSADRMMLHCRAMSFVAGDGRTVSALAPPGDEFSGICSGFGISLPR